MPLNGITIRHLGWSPALVAVVWFGCSQAPLHCQTLPSKSAQVQPAPPQTTRDPTHPELQLGLDLDRDPISSPDAEGEPTFNAATPITPAGPGQIEKRQDGIYTMHKDVDEVLLTCAVVDEKGRPVPDLGRANFRIWEDGVAQTTSSFLHQDQPVSLGILVDNSGSMLDKRAAVNSAALTLVRALGPKDATFIVNFSDRAILDQGFTSDIDELNRALARFDSKGTTALYDAVAASADELTSHGKLPKQVLLVITDGADNASHLDLEEAVQRVQKLGGPVVYAIGLLFDSDKLESDRAKTALERLSRETGGISYFPHSLQDVDEIAGEVARDIQDQYTIGYHSTMPASLGGYRVLRVEAKASKHGNLTVRTRKGYFANKLKSPPPTQVSEAAPGIKP